jgi:hypothetical protein
MIGWLLLGYGGQWPQQRPLDHRELPRRVVEPRDRHPPVHQRTHRPLPPAQSFAKLGITSRSQLGNVLPSSPATFQQSQAGSPTF